MNWLTVRQSSITNDLLLQNMGVVMKMDLKQCCRWGVRASFFLCVSVGPDKSFCFDEYYLLAPAWSGDIASSTFSSSAWSLLLLSACLFKVWISSSGISRSLFTSFSFFPIFLDIKHEGQTCKRHHKYPFIFPYFTDTQQVKWWQWMASGTGRGSTLGSLGRAVSILSEGKMSGFIVDQNYSFWTKK